MRDPYLDSKRAAEKVVRDSGLSYVIIRPGMLYGPGDKKNIGLLAALAQKLPFLPVLSFRIQPLFIADLVRVIAGCLAGPDKNIYNVAGPETLSCLDIYREFKKQGYNFRIINWPRFFSTAIRLVAYFPFAPLPAWQVKSLLTDETFSGADWPRIFKIKPTFFREGVSRL